MKPALQATFAVVAILCGSTGYAANISGQGLYLDPSATARYIKTINDQLFDMGIDPETSAFKVRANITIQTHCIAAHNNLCYYQEQVRKLECPKTIPVKQPNGSYADVAVTCNPPEPDADGNCECEVAH